MSKFQHQRQHTGVQNMPQNKHKSKEKNKPKRGKKQKNARIQHLKNQYKKNSLPYVCARANLRNNFTDWSSMMFDAKTNFLTEQCFKFVSKPSLSVKHIRREPTRMSLASSTQLIESNYTKSNQFNKFTFSSIDYAQREPIRMHFLEHKNVSAPFIESNGQNYNQFDDFTLNNNYNLRTHLLHDIYPYTIYTNTYSDVLDQKQDLDQKQYLDQKRNFDFADHVIHKLFEVNRPYNQRKPNSGMYYASEYDKSRHYHLINGLAPTKYWDQYEGDLIYFGTNNHQGHKFTASDALSALFVGPTFGECGTVLLATIHHALCMIKGKTEFDLLFGNTPTKLIITTPLFQPFRRYGRTLCGNPLLSLFDTIPKLSLDELKHGDYVYIRGVDKYSKKHSSGDGQGWNVIVVKGKCETKFLGFGPETFSDGPITYEQLIRAMIDYYNSDQNAMTLHYVNTYNDEDAKIARILKNDKIEYDYTHVGQITKGLRLNIKALDDLSVHSLQKNL